MDVTKVLENACAMAANVSATGALLSDKGNAQFKKLWSSMQILVREELLSVLEESLSNAEIDLAATPKMTSLLDLMGFVQDNDNNLVMVANSSICDVCRTPAIARFSDLVESLAPDEIMIMRSMLCDAKMQFKKDMPNLMNAWMMRNLDNIAFNDLDMEIIRKRFNPFLQKFYTSAMQNGPRKSDECDSH
jgi:hypothetical protein